MNLGRDYDEKDLSLRYDEFEINVLYDSISKLTLLTSLEITQTINEENRMPFQIIAGIIALIISKNNKEEALK